MNYLEEEAINDNCFMQENDIFRTAVKKNLNEDFIRKKSLSDAHKNYPSNITFFI